MTESRFDLRFDLAVQAAKALDAKIEVAVKAAFDEGMDFVRSRELVTETPDPFAIRDIFAPIVNTVSYKGGPWSPELDTPAGFIRYNRPKNWKVGQSLLGRVI